MWPGRTSPKIISVLYKPAYRLLQGTGGGVHCKSSKTYLVENGGGRSAPIQSWSRIRASQSTK